VKHWKLPLAAALAAIGLQACDVTVHEPPRTTVNAPQNSVPDDTQRAPATAAQSADASTSTAAAGTPQPQQPTVPLDATPGAAPTTGTDASAQAPSADPQAATMGAPAAAPMPADGVAAATELQRFLEESGTAADRSAQSGQKTQDAQGSKRSEAKPADKGGKVSSNLPTVRDPGDPEGARLLAQRALEVPVAGIQPTALSDNYEQSRGSRKHEAIDILAPMGTPVVAVDDGRIAKLFTSKAGGLTIYQFDREARLAYYYAHLQRYAGTVREGMDVRRGDLIGYVGTTGNADANVPHLHFAVFKLGTPPKWWQGDAVNPYPALARAEPADQVAVR
jgi:murein DD-endopeptidase MepM/ murein hydrolase activator NlpD